MPPEKKQYDLNQSSSGCRRDFNSDEPVEALRIAYLQFRKGYNCALALFGIQVLIFVAFLYDFGKGPQETGQLSPVTPSFGTMPIALANLSETASV